MAHDHDHHDHDHGPAAPGGHKHDHAHGPHSHGEGAALPSLVVALVLTFLFMTFEFAAGHVTGSLALVADAWHMLSDVASLGLAASAIWLGRRPRSARKTFGYKRFEVLAALGNGVLLGVASVLIAVEAVERWRAPSPVMGSGVIIVGAAGLVVNLVCAWVLHRGASSLNVRAALAHVLGDALGSLAAILAGVVVTVTGETRADPAFSFVVCAILLWGAWRIVSATAHILMEGTPEGLDPVEIERAIGEVPGVASVHDFHVWSIAPGEPAVTAHVVLQPGGYHGDHVARAVGDSLERRFAIRHSTIQPEPSPPKIVQLGRPPAT